MSIAFALTIAALAAATPQSVPQPAVKAGVEAWEAGDFKRATDLWRDPAIAGDADAQFNLGQAYKLGRGVGTDLRQAEAWYGRAAKQGHRQAQDNYGLLLYQDNRHADAMPWLKASAERGEPRAQYVYGTELFNGELAPKDWVRAYAMMTRASTAGIPRAGESLAQMDRYIPAPERQRGQEMARAMERTPVRPILASATPGKPAPRPKPTATVATPKPKPVRPVVASGGKWRVQLGAFGDAARAQSLFAGLARKVPALGQAHLVKAGAVTRLQAGGYASQSAATAVCASVKAAGNPCLVVKP